MHGFIGVEGTPIITRGPPISPGPPKFKNSFFGPQNTFFEKLVAPPMLTSSPPMLVISIYLYVSHIYYKEQTDRDEASLL